MHHSGCEPQAIAAGASGQSIFEVVDVPWWVAHTRPRCEKKVVDYCQEQNFLSALPTYRSTHKYRGKKVVFEKPLFPGYVFLRLLPHQRQRLFQSDYVANLLEVHDQALLARQLADIFRAVQADFEIRVAPEIGPGKRVRIVRGALRGMEGWVEERYGMTTVLLRLDFIGQAAAVKLEAEVLELV